ncbi:GNAT family N-acetyltransferase [Streptomyces mauvecolor]|uniref:GNAT family N-acetyltransferase n=1 Tax=Streptomyces mauvecolor TaxID=58345 RepID=A0ABV9UWV9_9ACTN
MVRVRIMGDTDVPAVAEIRVRGWQEAYAGIVPGSCLDAMSTEETARRTRERLADPAGTTTDVVAVAEDHEILGWAAFGPNTDTGWALHALYVRPDRIGTGVGRALLAAVHEAVGPGAAVELWVLRDNARARRFYELAGYAPDGAEEQEDYDGVPVTELRYRRAPVRSSGAAVQHLEARVGPVVRPEVRAVRGDSGG